MSRKQEKFEGAPEFEFRAIILLSQLLHIFTSFHLAHFTSSKSILVSAYPD